MPHSFGYRARTRDLFSRDFRKHGTINGTTYLRTYKIGQVVDIKANGAVHKGMPHKFYHGKTGVVWNVTKRAIGVEVNKLVGNRIMAKRIHVRVEHVNHSKCRQEFLDRARKNDEGGIVGVATTLPAVFEGFWERLEAVKEAAAAYRLQPALQALATHGAEYERAAFERDFPIGMDMPRTEAWLNDTPAPARDVGKTVAAGVARLLCSAESPTAETLPETLVLDADRLESLHEQAARLTIVASAGLLVKQALTKVGVPLKLIAQVVDEPALASEAGQSTATTEQLTPREETLVPVLRTGLAGVLEPPTTATFTTQVGGGNEEEGTADGHVEDGELASPIARRMLPDIFHLLEPPAPPEDSVLTVISGGCAAVCAQAGIEWSDKENQALQTALRGVLTGRSPILTVMKKRLGSALAAALLPDGPVAEMVPAPQELKKHGLAAVALPLVALATAARVVCDHQLKVHGTRLAAMLAAQ